ncbi:MAG: Crp/Fnr family transcriptional regulator [Balneolaceae bacterium]|nr:Crp/Fnr family transcriptional regulator [Balneolaceae bacterium]
MDLKKKDEKISASARIIPDLMKLGTVKTFEKGDVLFQEESLIQTIPIIISGSVKVYRTDDDYKEILLYYLTEGETCIMSLFGGMYNETSKVKAVASEDSEILMLPVYKAGALMKTHPDWIDYIFSLYHQRFTELLDVVNAVAFKKLDVRLHDLISKKAEITGTKTLMITHEELANELGTARVVVSRLLKQMEKESLVKLGRNQITLL